MHRIKEFMEFLLKENLLPDSFIHDNHWEHNFHLIIMLDPEFLSVGSSTPEWKKQLLEKLNEYQEWYKREVVPLKDAGIQKECVKMIDDNMERFRQAVNRSAKYNFEQWLDWITRLDIARKTDWKTSFPELAWHLTKHE
jgi:anion-transporting  ArsA/GET3 family ATPase